MTLRQISIRIYNLRQQIVSALLCCYFCFPVYAEAGQANEFAQTSVWDTSKSKFNVLCGQAIRKPQLPKLAALTSLTSKQAISIDAESANVQQSSISVFNGNVDARFEDTRLQAEYLEYDHIRNYLTADKKIIYTTPAIELTGDHIEIDGEKNKAEILNTSYYLFENGGHGKSPEIKILSRSKVKLADATYTTCPPGNNNWNLSSSSISLDNKNHQGTAKNALLKFYGVPFLWLPYFRFPFGTDRLSGFLAPSYASSNTNGNEYTIPYYWNIAANYDATFAPRYMSKRGTLFDTEFRYLSNNSAGKINIGFIQNDKILKKNRESYNWIHETQINQQWSGYVNVTYYSDNDYLTDFYGQLEEASLSHVEERAELKYAVTNWNFITRVQGYQTLSGASPYSRLPQFTLDYTGVERNNQLNYLFRSELVKFDHKNDTPTGFRLDLEPAITLPIVYSAGYIKPKLSLRITEYDLNNPDPGNDDQPGRSVPTFSVDSKMFLERDSGIGDLEILHTLEPRLFYLYRPDRDQSQLPNFDTITYDSTINQLFRENTTTGADFMPAANEISAGISTHYFRNDNGISLLSASIGRKYFLSKETSNTTPSPLIMEIIAHPSSKWSLVSNIETNEEKSRLAKGTSRLQYKSKKHGVINFLHRYERDLSESLDISGQWRITPRWQIFGRRNYDIFKHEEVELTYGLRYDNCCWAFRVLKRESAIVNDQTVYFELVLKGLSRLGQYNRIDPLVNNAIIDYSDD